MESRLLNPAVRRGATGISDATEQPLRRTTAGALPSVVPQASSIEVMSRLVGQSRACWPHLCVVLALQLISVPLGLLSPLPLKLVVDNVLGEQPLPAPLSAFVSVFGLQSTAAMLLLVCGLMVAISAASNLQVLASWWLHTYTGEKLVLDFRTRLFRHVQRLRMTFHNATPTPDTLYRIQQDAAAIQFIFLQGLVPMMTALVTVVGLLVVMARIDLTLAAMALVLCVPLFWLAHTCSRRIRTYSHRVKELDSSAMGVVQETLSLLRVVKVFSQEQREYQRFLGISQKRMDSQVKTALIQARFHVAVGLTISLGMAAGIYVGAEQVRAGEMSLGALLVAIAYMAQIYEPLRILSTKVPDLQSWLASTERALALFEQSPEIEDRADARPLARARGEIEFCGVSVRHGEQVVMENVSFKVAPGVRIGIIGPTGSGKSTLLSLLTRFQDPASGCILLDGCDLRAYRLADLRKQCAVVLQEPLLFSTTLAENIAYGKPSASREEIIEVARRARAHDFIVALPNGYDTEPGERGLQLSGGERQRIALARALLMNAPLLLLDEPTSSVDPHTEKLIMEAIDEIAAGRTTFIVAHRLSTLKKCDALLLVCGGTAQFYTTELDTVIEQLTEGPYPDMQRFRRSE